MKRNDLNQLKALVLSACNKYKDRLDRSRRLYIEERAHALRNDREVEYSIKKEVSDFFNINYSSVAFTGSAQLGFSAHKDKIFTRRNSDLDIACIDANLYQFCWIDIIDSTRAFTDNTKFSGLEDGEINLFKQSMLRRGMIRVKLLPRSKLSMSWKRFEDQMSRKYIDFFKGVSIAIYINEYAFCWKQDSALNLLTRG